jgi:hypothetical protein
MTRGYAFHYCSAYFESLNQRYLYLFVNIAVLRTCQPAVWPIFLLLLLHLVCVMMELTPNSKVTGDYAHL